MEKHEMELPKASSSDSEKLAFFMHEFKQLLASHASTLSRPQTTRVLYDIGIVSTKEPFKCVINQGIILGEVEYMVFRDKDGNSVSSDSAGEMIVFIKKKYLKKTDVKPWNTSGIEGVDRFLGRVWRLVVGSPSPDGSYRDGTVTVDDELTMEQLRTLHRCIQKVTEEIEGTRSILWERHPRSVIEAFVLLLSPYAPHMSEELWVRLGHNMSLAYEPFPKADPSYLKGSTVVLPVQINGKTGGYHSNRCCLH
ncbi:Leucine--tRNA ligase, chloroplastic/mitochondrial-like protein [Drosera capensis]